MPTWLVFAGPVTYRPLLLNNLHYNTVFIAGVSESKNHVAFKRFNECCEEEKYKEIWTTFRTVYLRNTLG